MSFRRLVSSFLFVLLVLSSTFAVTAVAAVAGEWTADEVRAILAERIDEQEKSVGIAIGLIDEQGSTVVGYGKLGATDDREPDGKTVFEIGSVSKVFTSILLADAVQRGKVGLNDPVQKYLPEEVLVPVRDDSAITLYHLSTHTSGLPRMPDNFTPADPTNPYADYSVEQMYEFLPRAELAGKPGADAAYSNYGTGLLGHVLALRAGSDYETLLRKRIAGPLKMKDTRIVLTPELEARLAHGHDAALQPASNWDIPTLAGAGAIRSTVDDMLLFLAANMGLTKSRISGAMQDSHLEREEFSGPGMHIGLGWIIRREHERTIHWHNGGTGGYHSFTGFDKERKRGVVVLSNSTNDIDDIGFHLLEPEFQLAQFKSETQAVEFAPERFDAYVGRYQLTPEFILSVTRDGDRYFVQATGQGMLEVFPESATRFFATAVEAAVSFELGEDGKVSHMVLHQGGLDQRADWLDADVAAAPEVVAVAEEILERYVGRYELQPGFVITVRRDGDKLFAQATAQPDFEIFAESETEFFYRVVDAQITFNTDEAGKTESLTLHQGGANMPAQRLAD
ncbi:MAG: serine hydrolase [bacterium]|nr:serine hydrolase [bacterium]